MAELPTGQVTFLFTDIEGSTRLLRELGPEQYARALGKHRSQLRRAFAWHGGVEMGTEGDAFLYVFGSPRAAIAAAAAGTEALAYGPIHVRIGVHTGWPRLTNEGYIGEDVHLGARIAAAGHGGQVLVSKPTRDLVDAEVLDLGEHRLKDFPEPVWIYQLGIQRFPPLRTITNTNLPRPASSFVGRQRELGELVALLRGGAGLVTLTGAGGSGKTRLAIEAAGRLVPEHRNGTFWVALAPVRDPGLVADTISQTLGARDSLADYIADRDLLLVLDNFEQVTQAAPEVASLVEHCPNLTLLVTSRELLRVRGEVEYSVPPLTDLEAVELFSARSGVPPDETIRELCRRLDNLPLAVELAAGRARILSPTQLLERLSERLDLLKGGRDAEARQRTLRATIEWSYELLDQAERRLLGRLSVFAEGCTLAAAEEVCDADLDTLQSLAEKSLLTQAGERFTLLETIREYAAERLEAAGEAEAMRRRHAEWVLELATEAEPKLHGAEQLEWLDRLDLEHGNLRAALAWALAQGDGELGGRIAAASLWFWQLRSHLGEGERWLGEAVRRSTRWPVSLRARVLQGHGQLSYYRVAAVDIGTPLTEQEAAAIAAKVLEEAARVARASGSIRPLAQTLAYLSIAAGEGGDPERSLTAGEEAVRVARETGDNWTLGLALWAFGTTIVQGVSSERDLDLAAALLRESVDRLRPTGDRWALGAPLFYLGVVARRHGNLGRAFELIAEAASHIRAIGDKYRLASGVRYLAGVAEERGDTDAAAGLRAEADMLDHELVRLRAG